MAAIEHLEVHPRYVQPQDGLWGRFHAIGRDVNGDDWDDRRRALCGYFTKARTSSCKRLYPQEMLAIIDHLEAEKELFQ